MEAKIIKVDFTQRGKEQRWMQADRKVDNWWDKLEYRIRQAIERSK